MNNLSSIQQAKSAAATGDPKTAMAILRDLIKQNPSDVDAWLALADIAEKPEQTTQCLERVLQIDPDNQIAQQKLSGEQPDEFDFLFETADEPVQEPEVIQEEAPALDFSNLYTTEEQPAESSYEQSQPQPPATDVIELEDPSPQSTTASTTGEASSGQKPPPRKRPTTKKRAQKKKKGLSGIEIGLIILIVFMCLCLCVIGVAALGNNAVLESFGSSGFLEMGPTDMPDDVTAVIYENISASNGKDFNRYMATIHSQSPVYNTTEQTVEEAFSDEFTLSYRVDDVYIIKQGRNEAIVHFVLTTKLYSGSISFRDNRVTGEMTLRKEDGAWKIYNQKVDNVDYLD